MCALFALYCFALTAPHRGPVVVTLDLYGYHISYFHAKEQGSDPGRRTKSLSADAKVEGNPDWEVS